MGPQKMKMAPGVGQGTVVQIFGPQSLGQLHARMILSLFGPLYLLLEVCRVTLYRMTVLTKSLNELFKSMPEEPWIVFFF